MESQERKILIDDWVRTHIQFEYYNDKLKELAKEILNYVKNNYSILLAGFAQGFPIYLTKVEIINKKLYISYTDNWADCPEYASLDIPVSEVWHYEKYFENLYNEYSEKENNKIKEAEKDKEEKEYQTYIRLKQKFES